MRIDRLELEDIGPFVSADLDFTGAQVVVLIQKFQLSREPLAHRRARRLLEMQHVVIRLQQRRLDDGGRALTDAERQLLQRFGHPREPYSACCKSAPRAFDVA